MLNSMILGKLRDENRPKTLQQLKTVLKYGYRPVRGAYEESSSILSGPSVPGGPHPGLAPSRDPRPFSDPFRRAAVTSGLTLAGRLQEGDPLATDPFGRDFRIGTVTNLIVVLHPDSATHAICDLVRNGHVDFATLDAQRRPTGIGSYDSWAV
jgi:hypothetical protein